LTVVASHDGPWFKLMSDNAWHRSHGLRAFPDVSNRPAWLSDGEHGGQAAAEGQRGNNASR